MAPLEFTDEEFNSILQKAQVFYPNIGAVHCPYFRQSIQFTSEGLEHLRRKAWNRGRSRSDQFMRLKHLVTAPRILHLSHTVQGIWRAHDRVRRRRHGRWEELFLPAVFYEFIAVLDDRRFKVIVKAMEGEPKIFWSLIPFWRQNEWGTRELHDGDPAQD